MAQNIADMLLKMGLLTKAQYDQAALEQKNSNEPLAATMVRMGMVTENVAMQFMSRQFTVPAMDLSNFQVESAVIKLVRPDIANKFMVIPIKRLGRALTLAMIDPSDIFALEDIKFLTGLDVKPVVASYSAVKKLLEQHYPLGKDVQVIASGGQLSQVKEEAIESLPEDTALEGLGEDIEMEMVDDLEQDEDLADAQQAGSSTPVVKMVNYIMTEAVRRGASDIHVEPYEKVFRIRLRQDGVLQTLMEPPMRMKAPLVSRIKIMSKLDVTERRKPQDGRIAIKVLNKKIDLRVSTLPVLFGEKVVMRILDAGSLTLDLANFGFTELALKNFMKAIHAPYGIVLITGPTGSGKTTTLYSALSQLNTPDRHILTVEDPIEYNLKGVNQVQAELGIGFTFDVALRAMLRQAPNIIMLGEIRDGPTAAIAVKAALTGHLVLSTLHTNDAPSSVSRLIDMGIEPFLVASSTVLIQAQRLVRRICKACKEPFQINPQSLIDMGFKAEEVAGVTYYKGRGCPICNNTGYKGRVGLYEVMPISPDIRDLILNREAVTSIRAKAVEQGMLTLRMDAWGKVKQGLTTVEEMFRETAEG
ncbi:MAG: type II secretion system protein GspE [Candidatus Edwardsbacteria bacterium RIFOXYD12_FULL_50_11]|uniref:Type II secretion system protein GspE n=1 Tax=Candidatus Edwardsbacteria bacterium GWF2_54_11 TaxID=1817851 RepID=A0A1F5R9Q7_9BACT|nr:MAG: type II secretion system protein GspE [Candidatus Edwardsbacteria bacterium RifOxyC12_full_54_24]OGF08175.1 MAG: type II secretion system protein GspE [Candidatus Edwardsbacteria bacterium RifOxyA12_full_54_48]OGF11170.1 MAG: type II secretion system protein GspE [Candidatus Edwardsbacteria bacterium GWF2_54_11]OGF11472.1 MAG: type II secretion system protein GspE [Candidatus Edwardsbacteria bacterium GWE2_54_12]OGF14775.1 MAG: type II secretion system protein GspE [Candidatus Edwardsba